MSLCSVLKQILGMSLDQFKRRTNDELNKKSGVAYKRQMHKWESKERTYEFGQAIRNVIQTKKQTSQ